MREEARGHDRVPMPRPNPPSAISEPGRQSASQAIRPLWMQVYLPNLLLATGQGAMIPVLVYAAQHVHASPAVAGAIVAVNSFGTMFFDLPSGRIVARFGEWRSGWIAAVLLSVGLLGCLFAHSVAELAISVFLQAAGWSVWSLVRMTHLSRVAPFYARGRALSVFGGVTRAGNVIGPFLFFAFATRNDVDVAFLIYLVCVLVGFAWLVAARDRSDHEASLGGAERIRPIRVLRDHRRGLATAGIGALGISLLRGSRTAIVPLWAAHIGLSSSSAAILFATSSLIDLALFYPAGVASDRWGRRAVALPCITLLSIGHLLIPFSHAFLSLFWVAFLLGFGNGLGAGIVMTLGADLTPAVGRASFLAVWRLISDTGNFAGPLVDSGIVALGAIALAGPAVGIIGLLAATVVAFWLPEPKHLAGALQEPEAAGS